MPLPDRRAAAALRNRKFMARARFAQAWWHVICKVAGVKLEAEVIAR
jgi:hypothetical protein